MRSSDFMAALPDAVQRCLGDDLRLKRGRLWPWGVQFYVDDPRYHYEVSRVAPRLGDRLELGLHFESKNPVDNQRCWPASIRVWSKIKDSLGDGVVAELWDRGWAKVYEIVPLEPYGESYLQAVAARMAGMVRVLHPSIRSIRR